MGATCGGIKQPKPKDNLHKGVVEAIPATLETMNRQ